MKRKVRKEVLYQCKVCSSEYSTKKEAKACERRPFEQQVFQPGNHVYGVDTRTCAVKNRDYRLVGKVARIVGPKAPDEEYENKWLGGKRERLQSHVWQYEVRFQCPHCKRKLHGMYFTPEIKLNWR